MNDVAIGRETKNIELQQYAQKRVDCFTEQLNESNPILTAISEAMAEEGFCQANVSRYATEANSVEAVEWQAKLVAATERKQLANTRLLECSDHFNRRMKSIRESRGSVGVL